VRSTDRARNDIISRTVTLELADHYNGFPPKVTACAEAAAKFFFKIKLLRVPCAYRRGKSLGIAIGGRVRSRTIRQSVRKRTEIKSYPLDVRAAALVLSRSISEQD